MKKFLFSALALTMLATACKKSEDKGPSNTWKVGATTYTAAQVTTAGSVLSATTAENGGNGISFAFTGMSALPTASGTYTIKDNATGANEVSVVASENSSAGAYRIPSGGTLTVTVSSGKITVDLPATTAKYTGMTTKADVQLSAHIAQP